MLKITGLKAGYGALGVLQGIDLEAPAGQITCIMGRNGVGKTTLMRAIMGQVQASAGSVRLGTTELVGMKPHRVPAQGLAWVPQGRQLFGEMSVAENLALGGLIRGNRRQTLVRVLEMFPRLAERLEQQAGTLSGGEQQMLAIGRALCLEPQLLLLDEPTEGLQPSIIAQIRAVLLCLKAEGTAIVLVEQKVEAVLALADQVAFMAQGRLVAHRARADLQPGAPEFGEFVGV